MQTIKRDTVWVSVYQTDRYELPNNLQEFIAFFQKLLDVIPLDFKHESFIEIDSEGNINIGYSRAETDEEYHSRSEGIKKTLEAIRIHEIEQLRALRAKYPNEY